MPTDVHNFDDLNVYRSLILVAVVIEVCRGRTYSALYVWCIVGAWKRSGRLQWDLPHKLRHPTQELQKAVSSAGWYGRVEPGHIHTYIYTYIMLTYVLTKWLLWLANHFSIAILICWWRILKQIISSSHAGVCVGGDDALSAQPIHRSLGARLEYMNAMNILLTYSIC